MRTDGFNLPGFSLHKIHDVVNCTLGYLGDKVSAV